MTFYFAGFSRAVNAKNNVAHAPTSLALVPAEPAMLGSALNLRTPLHSHPATPYQATPFSFLCMRHRIHILAGPTAVGKTALALRWAKAHGAQIINADALLFYQGMDIGTAKPSLTEQAQVPHRLIDIVPPCEAMSVKRYAQMAAQAVQDIVQTQDSPVLVVGGSGFYLKSFFEPVADSVEPDAIVRAHVDALEAEGLAALVAALHKASPEGTGSVDLLNPRRVARALERCLITGKSICALEADFATQPRPFADYEKRLCLLLAPNETLHPRIETRTEAMLANGLVDETAQLLKAGIEHNPAAASAIGYRETIAYLKGQSQQTSRSALPAPTSLSELAAQINLNTRRLVAKQRKWFRTQVRASSTLERTGNNNDDALYEALCACFGD